MRTWSQAQDDMMREFYPDHSMKDLMQMVGKSECAIYNRANTLNIKKSQSYLDSPAACRLRRGGEVGKAFRFKKGQTPPNKGKKQSDYMSKEAIERTKATRFTAGSKPLNHRPVLSTRIDTDGYKYIKVAEGMHKYKLFHRVLWERMCGSIPKNMVLIFRDGNKQNFAITNLELLTRRQNMNRNTVHRLPKELAELVQLRGALNRQINRRLEHGE